MLGKKNCVKMKFWIQNNFGQKILDPRNFRFKIILGPNNFGSQKFGSAWTNVIMVLDGPTNLPLKFGENWNLISKVVWNSYYWPKHSSSMPKYGSQSNDLCFVSEVFGSSFKNLQYTSVFDKLGKMSPEQMFPGQMSL